VSIVGALAADTLAEAIVRAVSTAEPLGGLPSARALGTAPRASDKHAREPASRLIAIYSVAVVGFGLWTSRYVRGSSDFFVAGRSLGPGLIFSSMLAANIGAGATVNAAGLAYRDGLSAWWWSGSAGLASFVLAFWVGPRLWALAKEHDFYTTGDFLEHRYGSAVRGIVSVLVTFGCLWILAAQLMAGAAILNVLTGAPRWLGSLIGGGIMTVYFAAGGLLGTSLVNTFQLVVMLGGFAVALPFVIGHVGGLDAFAASSLPATFDDITYSAGPGSGWTFLALTGPAFVISPGLIQKSYGAVSARALKIGVGLNAVGLLLFAFVPVLLGWPARGAAAAGQPGPGAASGAAAAAAHVARRARARRRVLHRGRYQRRHPLHDLDVDVEGHLQAIPEAGRERRRAAARGAPVGRRRRHAGRAALDLSERHRPGDDGVLLAAGREPVRARCSGGCIRGGPGRPRRWGPSPPAC
jgi:hypothetical protein